MRKAIVRLLLGVLNSRWLNQSPCVYAFVGNIDNFSEESLRSEVSQRPDITVAELLKEAERWKSCPITNGLTVIDGDEIREATVWDIHELNNLKG